MNTTLKFGLLLILALLLASCRGTPFKKPPIHPQQNMDFQEKFEAQESNSFFADGRAMRLPVSGTVARGHLKLDTEFYQGRDADGELVARIPFEIDKAFILRGREQYEIFCTPCHGGLGDGKGIVARYPIVPPTSYHSDQMRAKPDGHYYDVISNGARSMYSYGAQITPEDRWAIVAYIRVLQRTQGASEADLGGHQFTDAEKQAWRDAQAAAAAEEEDFL